MNILKDLQNSRKAKDRKGAMMVLIAIMMIAFMATVAFTVDIAFMHLTRTELRTATDAASKAAAIELSETNDRDAAIARGQQIALQNTVAGDGLSIAGGDFDFGRSAQLQNGKFEFDASASPINSVRVNGDRTRGSIDGPVNLFFGNVLGFDTFEPTQVATAAASARDIALVLDVSGSMQQTDAGGGLSRRQALINAVNDFINELEASSPNSQLSITTYSTQARRDLPLTDNLAQVRAIVNGLPAAGFTNIFRGLRLGSDSLEQDPNRKGFAQRSIVVMTDGNFNVGGTPIPSANLAANRGHTIHAITFSSGANQNIMRQVANIGSGQHFHADDAGDLSEAFREIARTIAVTLTE